MMNKKQLLRKKAHQELVIVFCSSMVILVFVLWAAVSHAGQAKFSWDPNTESDLAGYKIYCKAETDADYPVQGTDVGLPATGDDGKVYSDLIEVPDTASSCVATAYDSAGNESAHSNEATFDLAPNPPGNLQVIVNVQVNVTTN